MSSCVWYYCPMSDEKGFLTVQETMAILKKSRPTIMSWIHNGVFPRAEKQPGETGEWLIPWGDVVNKRQQIVRKLQKELDYLMARIP
jgi:predicted DNA-binding transcriptional regulator AlpA